jgi:hypothetical protein
LTKAQKANAFDGIGNDYKQQYNEKVITRLGKQLQETIDYNHSHEQKKYFVQDGDALQYFYHYFSSNAAADLISPDLHITGNRADDGKAINDYINTLRTKYLPAKYKDYQIYFMVAGMYYVPDISQDDVTKSLDWSKVRSLSFDKIPATSTPAPYVPTAEKQNSITQEFSNKINKGVYYKLLKQLNVQVSITDKTIIFYKWLLFDIDIKNETLESYLRTGNIDDASLKKAAQPVMFMSSGYFTKKNTASSREFAGLNSFLQADKDYSDIISVDNMPYQRNKLMKDVTNAFVYFYQKDNSLIPSNFCDLDKDGKNKALDVLAASYKNAPTGRWEDAPFRNPILFQNITWETRKCIFDYLLSKQYCNDAKGAVLNNACEDMLVDAIGAVRSLSTDEQKKVLDYFNDPANYKQLFEQVHDAGGSDNYTGVIVLLTNLAAKNNYADAKQNSIGEALFNFQNTTKNIGAVSFEKTSFTQAVEASAINLSIVTTTYNWVDDNIGYGGNQNTQESFKCAPFTPVQFVYSDKLDFKVQKADGGQPIPGEIVTVPALYLHWLVYNDFKTESIKEIQTAVLVASMVSGAGELTMTASTAARLWASADVFFTATALVSDNKDFQIYVKNKYGDNGLQTLSFINNAGKYFAGAYMGRGAINYISSSLEKKAIHETLKLMQEDAELSARYKPVFDAVDAEAVRLDKEGEALAKAGTTGDAVGTYTEKIRWGIQDIDVRPFEKGYWGKRISQMDARVDAFELKINPNNESFYLPHPDGGYVQFENMVNGALQDGKLVMDQSSIYHVLDKPEFLTTKSVYEPAQRQLAAARAAGYKVEWLVSDEKAVSQLQQYFKDKNIDISVKLLKE